MRSRRSKRPTFRTRRSGFPDAMRRLLLLRHAKSDWADGVPDRDRPLNERGRTTAPRVGAYLAAERLRPDHVMVSPARRTLETWERLRGPLEGLEAETVPSLYEATASRILDAVRSAPDTAPSLMVIGHNPGLERLAAFLVGSGDAAARSAMRAKFPTAALAVIDFEAEQWASIEGQAGRLERFIVPRDLA